LDADARLCCCGRSGARYLGEAAADPRCGGEFQLQSCSLAKRRSELGIRHPQVEVTLNQFPDRIEVTIVTMRMAVVGLHTLLRAGANPMKAGQGAYEKKADSSITRLQNSSPARVISRRR